MSKGFFEYKGSTWYRIDNAETMPEFFMTLVSSGDHWMFISSKGALSAGRKNPAGAVFPYDTVDKIYQYAGHTGTKTSFDVGSHPAAAGRRVWEPFADWTKSVWNSTRSIAKNFTGSQVIFEEENLDLALRFRWIWSFSHRYGFVRRAELENLGAQTVRLGITDGFLNIMNGGVTRQLQASMSCLVDAYKDNCLDLDSSLAVYSLASLITDKAEPREGLAATVAWSCGLSEARLALSRDNEGTTQQRVKGKKSDYLVLVDCELSPKAARTWYTVVDGGYDHAKVFALRDELKAARTKSPQTMPQVLEADAQRIDSELRSFLAKADGLSASAKTMHEWHHGANVLFNIMRGGIPAGGTTLNVADVLSFLKTRNKKLSAKAETLLAGRKNIEHREFKAIFQSAPETALQRLALEYLPLTFSRRHGDPSRPWNEFSIRIAADDGSPLLDYQGNWRDIFQNWEALGQSYPDYLESFMTVFLDATTVDGYNPYRITRSGIDWERVEPDNPWSNIGYWNDHQIIYFQKLAESLDARQPARLAELTKTKRYSYADVPYRIAKYAAMCHNPRSTISFDHEADHRVDARVTELGGDGRLVHGPDSSIYHGTLTEKLLSLASAKIGNLVPGGGIWLNTQRPEWNDANNALAGYGLSIVTVAYLRRFASFWAKIFASLPQEYIQVSKPLVQLVQAQSQVLTKSSKTGIKDFMDSMGQALDAFKSQAYVPEMFTQQDSLSTSDIAVYFGLIQTALDSSLAQAKRKDGLYDSYNILAFSADNKTAQVERLYPMLEGQVAVLSSGYLDAEGGLALYQAMHKAGLYREDQASWLLYPERELPDFFTKNAVPAHALAQSKLAQRLLSEKKTAILYTDSQGQGHFGPEMQNAMELTKSLDNLALLPQWKDAIDAGKAELLALYEAVFSHASFTGRSGSMYAYEGLGSIYWHMVAKLMLAYMELRNEAAQKGNKQAAQKLEQIYLDIRRGIGYQKSPEVWGAFPWDPYSHTPRHAGAQQPGMTGQVKEEVLTRLMEFGLEVRGGEIHILPTRLLDGEYLDAGRDFSWIDVAGLEDHIELKAGDIACTLCQVPIIRRKNEVSPAKIQVTLRDGTVLDYGANLGRELSAQIFARDGRVRFIRA